MNGGRGLIRSLLPEPARLPTAEVARSALAAAVGVFAVMAASHWLLHSPLFVVASVGASAVLVFALPASPLAQPWAVVGGYGICALAGMAAVHTGLALPLAGGLAVGLSLAGMLILRCLHAPGGAVALFAVIGGEGVRALDWKYVLTPVLPNAMLLVAVALVINNLLPGRRYPHVLALSHAHPSGFSGDDLRAALADYEHPLAVSEQELDEIVSLAEKHAARRIAGQ